MKFKRVMVALGIIVLALGAFAQTSQPIPAQNPALGGLSPDCCTLAAAQANQLASSKIMVANLNANLTTIYLSKFNDWKISVDAGRIPNTNPPQPPNGYVVSAPDANGFQWPAVGSQAVVPMPPIPADHFTVVPKTPNTIDVGTSIGGKWFSVGDKDTEPSGFVTPPIPDASGTLHTYEKYGAPVGPGWYLQIS